MMPESKADYVRCRHTHRYCSRLCIYCDTGVDETGTAQFYCWYPYRLHGKDPVTIARAEVVWADNYGNLFIGEVH